MTSLTFEKPTTALLVIDPYNDFIPEGGAVWNGLKVVAQANNCVPNLPQVLNAARRAELRIFYALHHRYRPGDYKNWEYMAPIQKTALALTFIAFTPELRFLLWKNVLF